MTREVLARLAVAPELIVVRVIEHDLALLLVALSVQHPTLDDQTGAATTPTLRRARAVARSAQRLRAHLRAYNASVRAAIMPTPHDDDLPF